MAMHATVFPVRKVELSLPPNGAYPGTWGGYVVRFSVGGADYEGQTQIGIRTPAAPVIVDVKDGTVTARLTGASDVH